MRSRSDKPADRGPATPAMRALLSELTEAIRAGRLGRIVRTISNDPRFQKKLQDQLIRAIRNVLAGLESNINDKDPEIRRSSRAALKQYQQLVPGFEPPTETVTNGDTKRAR
jgi:hypothetical protein